MDGFDDEDIFLAEDFDAEKALANTVAGDGEGDQTLEEFEKRLWEENPEEARLIFAKEDGIQEEKKISKKEQKRRREDKLREMTGRQGRSVFEEKKKRVKVPAELERMALSSGPFAVLAFAVKKGIRVEVRLGGSRAHVQRVLRGMPLSLDKQWNVTMGEADETWLLPSQANADEVLANSSTAMPPWLRWEEGGEWPFPRYNGRLLHRTLGFSFIKKDIIVFARLIKEKKS